MPSFTVQLLEVALAQKCSCGLQAAQSTLYTALVHDSPGVVEEMAKTTRYDEFVNVLPQVHQRHIYARKLKETINFSLINWSLFCEDQIYNVVVKQQKCVALQEEEQVAMQS